MSVGLLLPANGVPCGASLGIWPSGQPMPASSDPKVNTRICRSMLLIEEKPLQWHYVTLYYTEGAVDMITEWLHSKLVLYLRIVQPRGPSRAGGWQPPEMLTIPEENSVVKMMTKYIPLSVASLYNEMDEMVRLLVILQAISQWYLIPRCSMVLEYVPTFEPFLG